MITKLERDDLLKDIEALKNLEKSHQNAFVAEKTVKKILNTLLTSEGYKFSEANRVERTGVDFVASKQSFQIGIEYKHYNSNIGTKEVRSILGSAIIHKFDKVILLTSSEFTKSAREIASLADPIVIELIDLNDLNTWTVRLDSEHDDAELVQVLKDFTRKVIELLNKSPRILDQLEWRDLERVVAEMFSGIGFDVTLTAGSKDGGKDVILECVSNGTRKTYIVEIKHWRSNQKVGEGIVKDFVEIITSEKRDAGLFLSTYGFTENAVKSLTVVEKRKVRLGEETKIMSLCKTYLNRKSGIYDQQQDLSEILFDGTI